MGEPRRTLYIAMAAAALMVAALAVRKPLSRPHDAPPSGREPAFVLGVCPAPSAGTGTVPVAERGDPRARAAAQHGLDFLAREALSWQGTHNCYGCHVHAVTVEAMVVGVHNQYEVAPRDLNALVDGMIHLSGGARDQQGFAYQHGDLLAPSKAFGGAAIARYDQLLRNDLQQDLVRTAGELLGYQQPDGSIALNWVNGPVGAGVVQGTYQATQTWRQAYARTADDKWLLPISRAERYLRDATARMKMPNGEVVGNAQDVNYALMGLHEAGVSDGDGDVRTLVTHVLHRQNSDGGWGLDANGSSAFATGQTLYTLRLLGLSDGDPVIARGTAWLIAHQNGDGGWSHSGFGKAEAMWAVLGLVSVDVLSLSVAGVQDGQHADGKLSFSADARDNQAGGVVKVELAIDDVPAWGACGAHLSYGWNTDGASPGKHILDLVATNAQGHTSRRRMEVFTGPTYLTQVGSRSADDGTVVSARNIAGAPGGTVELHILTVEDRDGSPVPGHEVAQVTQSGLPGPTSLTWNGKGEKGESQPKGRYLGRLVYRKDGRVVQTEEIPIVRDTVEAQEKDYGQLEGLLQLKGGAGPAANTPVELVDKNNNVVQRGFSTSSGKYLFKNIDGGDYKVRVMKKGFAPVEKPVQSKPAKHDEQNLEL